MDDVSERPTTLGWYRSRATFRGRWPGYLTIVLLLGLVGGLAMASGAAARRTASSFSTFWASTNPSDLVGATGFLNSQLGLTGYDPRIIGTIAHLPYVKDVVSQSGLNIEPLAPDGAPIANIPDFSPGPGNGYGSDGAEFFSQDRVAVLQGHIANPADPDQFMLTQAEAALMRVKVGDTVRFGIYTNEQVNEPDFGSPRLAPYRVVDAKLVAIAEANDAVIEDQADAGTAPDNFFTPALTDQFLKCCVNYSESGVQVYGGQGNVARVQAEIAALGRKMTTEGAPGFAALTPAVVPKADRALRPLVIALGAFGCIVALACLLITGQLVTRQIRLGLAEREVLRALGASPAQVWGDGLAGIATSIVAGAALGVLVAAAISPIAPLGAVRPVYPDRGINFDWTVLGGGAVLILVVLGCLTAAASYLDSPNRLAGRRSFKEPAPSRLLNWVASAGVPAPALTGMRFATVPGSGRAAVPVRSAVLGAVMATVALVGTVTFGASLSSLVSHPRLYGWNWDYLLSAGANLPAKLSTSLLDHDPYISAWSGVYEGSVLVDGQVVPVVAEEPGTKVQPPLLSGHGLEAPSEVVLGAVTLAQLREHVGGTVTVSLPGGVSHQSWQLRVVGTATLPALGGGVSSSHLEMGNGAVLDYHLLPPEELNLFQVPDAGFEGVFVDLKRGVDHAAAYASLEKIARETTTPQNFGVTVVGVQRPAEILNYRTLGSTPAYLGSGLAAGAMAALALTLVTSVRRRRRDLALLKTLGFTQRQVAATVAWQSSISVGIGVVFGVPLGVALGRWLWDLFAHDINAVPSPSVPVLEVVLIAAGAFVLANLVAALPARVAARTPTALVLRSE
ncbi:MAG TPA: FtsX-like permease family protein [Acidimicrobiales bacterium]|nr:FtsX-like permease family protein [Acidimicrobiales bacterium]